MRVVAIVVSALLFGLVAVGFFLPNFTVSVPQSVIQDKISEVLPIGWKGLGAEAQVREATLAFNEDGSVGIVGAGDVEGYAMAGALALDAQTRMAYRNGAFYLVDLDIADLTVDLDEGSEAVLEERKALFGALKQRAAEALGKTDTAAVDAAKAEMGRIQDALVAKGREAIDAKLATTPVYDLSRAPGLMGWVPLAISDVRVENAALSITLSPSGLLGALALRAVLIALSVLASIGMVFGFAMQGRSS